MELASRGWEVIAGVRRDPQDELPDGVEAAHLDVTDPDASVIPQRLDLLINNAGVDNENLPLEAVNAEDWRRVFETNVIGLAEVTRLALGPLRRGTDAVVCNITSAGLAVPMPFFSVYRASKAAVAAITESLAIELAPIGIRVLEVLPGPVSTDMLAESATVPDAIEVKGSSDYRALADLVATLRPSTDDRAVPASQAAASIVDTIEAARAVRPGGVALRHSCDPVGAEVVGAWQQGPDEEHIQSYREVFDIAVDPDVG